MTREHEQNRQIPPPSPEDIASAHEAVRRADEQLTKAESREPDIQQRVEKLDRISREDRIGPRFWEALGVRRKQA